MSRAPCQIGLRWASAVLVSLLLAVGAATGATASVAVRASIALSQDVDPPAASVAVVEGGLGIKSVPAEIVFLIDLSDSMSRNGLYPHVKQELPAYLQTLAEQEPQDQVAVITFGGQGPGSAQVIYTGPPTPDIGLPSAANIDGTDFGQAFALAIDQLSRPPAGTRIGGVVLMSDGELYAPADSQYESYQAPGWQTLRARAADLPIKVTGYSLPLTANSGYIANQKMALSTVFATEQTLPSGTTHLAAAFSAAGQAVLDHEIAEAAAPDSGRGVRVTWSGLPSSGTPLNLGSPGHLGVRVTITALTRRIPLYLTGLGVESHGLPVTVDGQLPAEKMLAPGQSVTLPIQLSWQRDSSGISLSGGSRTVSGRLVLTGAVHSTYTPTLVSAFSDTSFSVGGLEGSSAQLTAMVAARGVLLILAIILLVLAVLACLVLFVIRLHGTLILTSVDYQSGELRLGPWPWKSARTEGLIGIPGRMTVRRSLFSRTMRLKLQLVGRPSGEVELEPYGRTMTVGIDIVHAGRR